MTASVPLSIAGFSAPAFGQLEKLFGDANIVAASLRRNGARAAVALGGITLDLPHNGAADGPVELAIRPERLRLAPGPGDNVLEARIEALVYQGGQTEVTTTLGDGQHVLVFVTEPAPAPLAPGLVVRLHLPAEAFMVLGDG